MDGMVSNYTYLVQGGSQYSNDSLKRSALTLLSHYKKINYHNGVVVVVVAVAVVVAEAVEEVVEEVVVVVVVVLVLHT